MSITEPLNQKLGRINGLFSLSPTPLLSFPLKPTLIRGSPHDAPPKLLVSANVFLIAEAQGQSSVLLSLNPPPQGPQLITSPSRCLIFIRLPGHQDPGLLSLWLLSSSPTSLWDGPELGPSWKSLCLLRCLGSLQICYL